MQSKAFSLMSSFYHRLMTCKLSLWERLFNSVYFRLSLFLYVQNRSQYHLKQTNSLAEKLWHQPKRIGAPSPQMLQYLKVRVTTQREGERLSELSMSITPQTHTQSGQHKKNGFTSVNKNTPVYNRDFRLSLRKYRLSLHTVPCSDSVSVILLWSISVVTNAILNLWSQSQDEIIWSNVMKSAPFWGCFAIKQSQPQMGFFFFFFFM